jgi:hypothetical protein
VADPIAPSVESPDVIFGGPGSNKMTCWRCPNAYVCGLIGVQGIFLSWVAFFRVFFFLLVSWIVPSIMFCNTAK